MTDQPTTARCPECGDSGACNGGPCPLLPAPGAGLREQYAGAMREHYLAANREEADADGNMPCRCGDWREGGDADEYDWDSHLADAVLAVRDRELEQLRAERDQYASAIRLLIDTVKVTAHHWSQTQPETMRRDDVVRALNDFARQHTQREHLRDDMWQRIVAAYYLRFENDGHPEDSQAAADEAMAIVQPELDALRAAIARVRRLCELTISTSVRSQAIAQARDTLAALDGQQQEAGR